VFLFSPPLILALLVPRRAWSGHWRFGLPALLFAVFVALAQGLFYLERWAGSFGWGLRFMLLILPPWAVLAAPAVASLLEARSRWRRRALPILLAGSGLIQLSGAWVTWRAAYAAWLARGLDPYALGAGWDPRFLAPAAQLPLLADARQWGVAWARLIRNGAFETAVVPLSAALVGAGALVLLRRRMGGRSGPSPTWAGVGVVGALALMLPFFPTLWAYRADPALGGDRPAFEQALAWVEAGIAPGDVVVVDSYATPLWTYWMNLWDQPVRWYALPFEIPGAPGVDTTPGADPSQASVSLFARLEGDALRLWYLTSEEAPDYGLRREITWLGDHYPLLARREFSGRAKVEARLYDLGGEPSGIPSYP
jgi:hypothetical protein